MKFHAKKKYLPLEVQSLPQLIVAGCDEAGRGPWAGPVSAAAVIIPPHTKLPGLNDSKVLTHQRREKLFQLIISRCDYGVGLVCNQEIDKIGLTAATNKAYALAIASLQQTPNFLLIDGRDKFKLPIPFTSIVKGDSKVREIAAASIIAKVTRDRLMISSHQQYPQYDFHLHKGYGTKRHHQALKKHGICQLHRQSYAPIKAIINHST